MDFELVSTLQYRNRSLSKQVEVFKSGEQYIRMEAENKRLVRFHNQEMRRMEYYALAGQLEEEHGKIKN